jgi:NodT family efflux transporter outer membrane factor (OMF) lipoprotein
MSRNSLVVVSLLAALAGACAVRTDAPETTIQPPATLATPRVSDGTFDAAWWRQFDDPVLDGLVDEAVSGNRDLRAASSRYEAALEIAGAAKAALLPSGGVTIGASRQHLALDQPGGRLMPSRTFSLVDAGLVVSWEADVFGRLRGAAGAALADAGAAQYDARGVRVLTAAAVARSYFQYRAARREVELLDALSARTRQMQEVTIARVANGRGTRLDTVRVQQIVEELVAARALALHQVEAARQALAVLTGRTADGWQVPSSEVAPLSARVLPIGAASDLLRRRPDVAAAELRLQAASLRAGVARAALFPRVDITGSIGLIAGSAGRLVESSAASWLIVPRLGWAVLDWPRLRRQMRAAGHVAEAAFFDYEQAVLAAIGDARTAIDRYGAAVEQLAAEDRRAQAADEAATIVSVQYREGLVDSFARTEAERQAIAAALAANRALFVQRSAVVDVYRAVGGGWQ